MLSKESAAGAELSRARVARECEYQPRPGPRSERLQRLIRQCFEHAGLATNGRWEWLGAR
jgi:hypothetical protein